MRVEIRQDPRIRSDSQLLLRFNRDADPRIVLRNSLSSAPDYRVLPGYESAGAVVVSCFLVTGRVEAEVIVRGTRWSYYGLASIGDVEALGCQVVATDITDEDGPIPLSELHVDVIVGVYPPGVGEYDQLPRAERARVLEQQLPRFERVLRTFDPRQLLEDR